VIQKINYSTVQVVLTAWQTIQLCSHHVNHIKLKCAKESIQASLSTVLQHHLWVTVKGHKECGVSRDVSSILDSGLGMVLHLEKNCMVSYVVSGVPSTQESIS